jgi:dUTP pyrophosphatase
MNLQIEKIYPDVKVPIKQNPTDSGFDVYIYNFKRLYQKTYNNSYNMHEEKCIENPEHKDGVLYLRSLERVLIGTGLKATYGPGYEIQMRDRSGVSLKEGLKVHNAPGTIDHLYIGEIGVILTNLSSAIKEIKIGERIAQLVVCPVELCEIELVEKLPETDRGEGGFGSTGK